MENKIKRWLDCSDSETAKELKGLNSDELSTVFTRKSSSALAVCEES